MQEWWWFHLRIEVQGTCYFKTPIACMEVKTMHDCGPSFINPRVLYLTCPEWKHSFNLSWAVIVGLVKPCCGNNLWMCCHSSWMPWGTVPGTPACRLPAGNLLMLDKRYIQGIVQVHITHTFLHTHPPHVPLLGENNAHTRFKNIHQLSLRNVKPDITLTQK